jgi:integrase
MKTRYESVAGVRNLYIDHARDGAPFVVRYKKDGKTQEVVLGVMPRKDAIVRRDEFFAKPLPTLSTGAPPKVGDEFDKWIVARANPKHRDYLATSTRKRYLGLWNNHVKGVLARLRIRDVEVKHIALVISRMQAKGLDANNAYVMMSSFFSDMTMAPYGYRLDNPVQRLGGLKPVAPSSDAVSEDAVITEEEVEQIILAIPSRIPTDKQVRQTLVRLTFLTGLRLSEVLGLTWEAIDLVEGELHVTQQLTIDFKAGDPETWFAPVKGNKTKVGSTARIIPLDDAAWDLLREHRNWVFSQGLYRGPESLVFPTKKLTPIRQSGVGEIFSMAVDRGFREARYPFTFHCLRHSFASQEFSRGTSIEEVARLLGHSSDVTQKRYIHLVDRKAYNEAFRARRRAMAQ